MTRAPTRRAGRGPRGRSPALAALCLAALAAAASAARMSQQPASASGLSGDSGDWRPPAFCRKKDCPRFDVVQTRDDVELRRYAPAHWITTNVSSSKWDDAYSEGYKRLERYAQGDNVNGTKLDATNPSFTLFYVADAKAHTLQATYTIEYFVPFELQDAPPRPNSTDLGVTRVEAQDVWVLSFGGFATEETVVTRGFEFMANLTGDGQEIEEAFIGLALYDQPARLVKRHNELWLWAKNAPSAAAAVQAPGPQRSAAQRWRQLFSAAWVAATGGERRN